MPIQFTVEHTPRYALIICKGRLSMTGASKLRETVAEVLSDGTQQVVVDLGATGFMDSSGLGALIGSLKLARQAGADLRIANVSPAVRMVLELTSMHRVLTPYNSAEEAFPAR